VTRLSNLYRIQTIDTQMDAQQSRLAELERLLTHHPELDAARQAEEAARHRQELARREVLRTEEETQSQQQKIKSADQTLYGGSIRNPKELQDLQQETASLRKFQTTLEERQLQAMVALEEADSAVTQAHALVTDLEQARAEQEAVWRAEQTQTQSQWEKFSMQREAAVVAVVPEDLELYQTLRKSKHGLAVARLASESCSGCGVAPSTSRLDSARSGQDIIQCGNCGRILYLG
jgi:uncharacterized protein